MQTYHDRQLVWVGQIKQTELVKRLNHIPYVNRKPTNVTSYLNVNFQDRLYYYDKKKKKTASKKYICKS